MYKLLLMMLCLTAFTMTTGCGGVEPGVADEESSEPVELTPEEESLEEEAAKNAAR